MHSSIAIEGMIMFPNNKTSQWLASKNDEDRAKILSSACQSATAMQKLYKQRQQEIKDHRVIVIEKELARKRQTEVCRREDLTTDVQKYGLWTSGEKVDTCLAVLRTVKEK